MRILLTLSAITLIMLCSCVDITQIRQPDSVGAGQAFDVNLGCSYTMSEDDQGDVSGVDYWGILAIQIPDDWKVVNTGYSGSNSGSFTEDSKVLAVVQLDYPAKEGYHWVAYHTFDSVQVKPEAKELIYDVKIKLQAGTTKGEFQPDYKIGVSEVPDIKSTSITWGETTVEVPKITVK
jgi:hypothetical protein